MTSPDDAWCPGAALLAAYFDGELDDRPELAALRRRVADWLGRHPEAYAELTDYARLAGLWQETTPPEPEPDAWRRIAARLQRLPARRAGAARRWRAGLLASAAAVALLLWLGLGQRRTPPAQVQQPVPPAPAVDAEVLPVATAAEVAILRVEGADTPTVVVGELPLHGPLELAGPGEVALTSVQPDARDRMMPHVRIGGAHRPMIWARVDAEAMDP